MPMHGMPGMHMPSTTPRRTGHSTSSPAAGSKQPAKITLVPAHPRVGGRTHVAMDLRTRSGKPAVDLLPVHTRFVHAIAISEDLTEFVHEHPVRRDPTTSKFEVDLKLGKAQNYRLWTEYQPKGAASAIASTLDFDVGTARPAAAKLVVDSSTPRRVAGLTVTLEGAEKLKAGKPARLTFNFKHNGKLVPVEPYLGAPGHMVLVSPDRATFMHVHGRTPKDPPMPTMNMSGMSMSTADSRAMTHMHTHSGMALNTSGQVIFDVTAPSKPGLYKLFMQVGHNGGAITVPFVISVA